MEDSPFQRPKANEEVTDRHKYGIYVQRKFKLLFLRVIPFLDDIHPDYLIPLSIVISVALAAIFVALFVTSYYTTLDQQYLSPTSQVSSSKYCNPISTTNTGEFLGTQSGLWEGSDGFQYAESAYTVSVTSFDTTYSNYVTLMNEVFQALVTTGNKATKQDLAQNLLYWMSLVFIVPFSNAQRFFLTGTPLTIFDRDNTGGSISSIHGVCNASSTASFDSSTGLLQINYNYQEYMESDVCTKAITPQQFGYMTGINSQFFSVKLDVRTLITSLAINLNITQLSDVVEIPGYAGNYTHDGVTYNISNYYDPKYPGMAPLICINGEIAQCILQVGDAYALPLFNHVGANYSFPTVCDCNKLTQAELDDKYNICNSFGFLSGILFWETPFPDAIFDLAEMYDFDYSQINSGSFNASFIGSFFGTTSASDVIHTESFRNSSFQFCNVTEYGHCSLLTFSSFDTMLNNWAISSYYYQLQNGACQNTFYTSYEDWQKLIDTPFAPLTQQYQQCKYSPSVTFIQVAGITMGNIYLLLPFCALFFVIVFQVYKRCLSDYHENLYTEFEIKQAMKTLSSTLLMARDGHLPQNTSSGNQSIDLLVTKLAQEMIDITDVMKHQKFTPAQVLNTPVSPTGLRTSLMERDSEAGSVHNQSHNLSQDKTTPSSDSNGNVNVSPIHVL